MSSDSLRPASWRAIDLAGKFRSRNRCRRISYWHYSPRNRLAESATLTAQGMRTRLYHQGTVGAVLVKGMHSFERDFFLRRHSAAPARHTGGPSRCPVARCQHIDVHATQLGQRLTSRPRLRNPNRRLEPQSACIPDASLVPPRLADVAGTPARTRGLSRSWPAQSSGITLPTASSPGISDRLRNVYLVAALTRPSR